MNQRWLAFMVCSLLTLSGCGAISTDDRAAENASVGAGIGGVLGAGTAAVLGAPKPLIGLAALSGAGLGYYFSTLRFASSGVIQSGGKVYAVGDYVVIETPTDQLFDTGTAEFLPGTSSALDSMVNILKRYPENNIIISGNTSGYGTSHDEQILSEHRAAQVAGYLWSHGITQGSPFAPYSIDLAKPRTLIYVGYGNAVSIANNLHLDGIRANSRIQIVASPRQEPLDFKRCKKCFKPFENMGRIDMENTPAAGHPTNYADAFPDDHMPPT